MVVCLSNPVHGVHCYWALCFDYVAQFGKMSQSSYIKFGHLAIAFTLSFVITIWNLTLLHKTYKKTGRISWMRVNNTIFTFSTGGFGLVRLKLELGRVLAAFANIHNASEWAFVCCIIYQYENQRKHGFKRCIGWILFVMFCVWILPYPLYLYVLQNCGIALDFLLPFLYLQLHLQNRNKSNKKTKIPKNMYLTPFIATFAFHLIGTILPLVISNFSQDQNETFSLFLETSIYVSVLITYILFTKFVSDHDKYVELPSIYNNGVYPANVVVHSPESIRNPDHRLLFLYILSGLIGFIPIGIIPKIILMANNGQHCQKAITPILNISYTSMNNNCDAVWGSCHYRIHHGMGNAFEYHIESTDFVNLAANYPGNNWYYFTKSITENNTYVFWESWQSIEIAYKWMNSDIVNDILRTNYTRSMMKGGRFAKMSGYKPLLWSDLRCNYNKNQNIGVGSVRHVFSEWNGCSDLWNDMIDFKNCEWILGCENIGFMNELNGERILYMQNGLNLSYVRNYENVNHVGEDVIQYNYSMSIKELHRTSKVLLVYDKNIYGIDGCVGTFTYYTNISIATVEEIYKIFTKENIPFLQQKYQYD
eukprot:284799_1